MFFGSGIFVLRFDISASIIPYYHQIYWNAAPGAVINITLNWNLAELFVYLGSLVENIALPLTLILSPKGRGDQH